MISRPLSITTSRGAWLTSGSGTRGDPVRGAAAAGWVIGAQLLVVVDDGAGELHPPLHRLAANLDRRGLEHRRIAFQFAQGEHGEEQRPQAKEADSALFGWNGHRVLEGDVRF